MARFHAMFGIPDDVSFHFCVPLGYPQGNFGPNSRKPTSATTYLGRWTLPYHGNEGRFVEYSLSQNYPHRDTVKGL